MENWIDDTNFVLIKWEYIRHLKTSSALNNVQAAVTHETNFEGFFVEHFEQS